MEGTLISVPGSEHIPSLRRQFLSGILPTKKYFLNSKSRELCLVSGSFSDLELMISKAVGFPQASKKSKIFKIQGCSETHAFKIQGCCCLICFTIKAKLIKLSVFLCHKRFNTTNFTHSVFLLKWVTVY